MFLPSFDLKGKTAVVTGAGRGIGRAIAIGFAEAGADVALMARTKDDLEEVAAHIRQIGQQVYIFETDIKEESQVKDAIATLEMEVGKIDILVNNAGMNIRTPAIDVTSEEWDHIVQTNLKGAFTMSQAVGRHMKKHQDGRIINITSVAGHVALRTGVVYGATKAALIQMTKTLALEWGNDGIRVNAIGPWYFRTPLTESLLQDESYVSEIKARTPLSRVGELEELVGPAVFLASDASNYMTGQTLFVDGGMTIYGF